nr:MULTISPECIES: AbrB/MazE/SpoVT family DNA-binding domain-containing protein [Paenibacillus]
MIRNLDSLGRIVVPVEIRMTRNIDIGDPIEFFILDDRIIVLRKYTSTECTFCRSLDNVSYFRDQFICNHCLQELADPSRPEETAELPAPPPEAIPAPNHSASGLRSKTDEMRRRLEAAIAEHPRANQKELARLLGISQARVSQLKRKIPPARPVAD